MLLAVTPDSFIPEEHPICRIKPIVEFGGSGPGPPRRSPLKSVQRPPRTSACTGPPRVPRRVRMEVRQVGRQDE